MVVIQSKSTIDAKQYWQLMIWNSNFSNLRIRKSFSTNDVRCAAIKTKMIYLKTRIRICLHTLVCVGGPTNPFH